jgi:Uma2 family endonuclease
VRGIFYPESDGKPMAENIKQLRWIVVLYGNLAALFRDRADVFVGGNQFWYPVEGEPDIVQAPDVYVVFGRPKGDRGSYKQWEEGGVPMTVVFEVLSPGNTYWEMADKYDFYTEHGVEEYYVYDPDRNRLDVYLRERTALRRVRKVDGFASPRLGIRFEMTQPEMTVFYPNGERFLSFEDLKATQEKAQRDADQARRDAEQARQLAARLAELSRKARRGQATEDELRELEQLENDVSSP